MDLPRTEPSALTKVATFLGQFRWLYMPLGLFALLAVGVHAAADTVDDRILWLIDRVSAAADAFFGQWSLTQPLVDVIGLRQRIAIARAFALVWEIAADVVLALPALNYEERPEPARPARKPSVRPEPSRGTGPWRTLALRAKADPTPLRVLRPLATFAMVLAGSCAVARMVRGALYLGVRGGLGDGFGGFLARVAGLFVLSGVLFSLGGRAVMRNWQHADALSEKDRFRSRKVRWSRGLIGSAIVVPLALAALLDAVPLLSFLR